ncbi:MAG TPA: helix-turn-helix domain-containing GNAT family N-acetyltransferase [Myxococcales bacterium]|nr:helix-turn-helix domain-containing GNAT family N-acetyltransferase [Myxococcales bacterium]
MQPRRASAAAAGTSLERRADAVRSFNRFYTRKIGVLQEKLLHGPFSLTEVRVLYELAHRDEPTASDLSEDLGLDPAYLSRMLRAFERRGLVKRRRSALDGRSSLLALTPAGKRALSPLEERARQEIAALLRNLSGGQQRTLLDSMKSIEELLGSGAPRAPAYLLRPLDPGDVGWVVERHGALYAAEYGWDERFEGLVARIAGEFLERSDPKRERCWIAERNGERIGSVFLVQGSRRVAKLRLLLVEPSARGLGVGSRLVEECIRFARLAGYRRLTLWTQSVLAAARRIYQRAGFHLVRQEKHHSFGHDLVGETWELDL